MPSSYLHYVRNRIEKNLHRILLALLASAAPIWYNGQSHELIQFKMPSRSCSGSENDQIRDVKDSYLPVDQLGRSEFIPLIFFDRNWRFRL